jgi:hypothetical protein
MRIEVKMPPESGIFVYPETIIPSDAGFYRSSYTKNKGQQA